MDSDPRAHWQDRKVAKWVVVAQSLSIFVYTNDDLSIQDGKRGRSATA